MVQTIGKSPIKDSLAPYKSKMPFPSVQGPTFKPSSLPSTPESSGTFTAARTMDRNKMRENNTYRDAIVQQEKLSTSSFYGSESKKVYETNINIKERPRRDSINLTRQDLVEKINKLSATSCVFPVPKKKTENADANLSNFEPCSENSYGKHLSYDSSTELRQDTNHGTVITQATLLQEESLQSKRYENELRVDEKLLGGGLKEAMNYLDSKEISKFTPPLKKSKNPPRSRKKTDNTDINLSIKKHYSKKPNNVEYVSDNSPAYSQESVLGTTSSVSTSSPLPKPGAEYVSYEPAPSVKKSELPPRNKKKLKCTDINLSNSKPYSEKPDADYVYDDPPAYSQESLLRTTSSVSISPPLRNLEAKWEESTSYSQETNSVFTFSLKSDAEHVSSEPTSLSQETNSVTASSPPSKVSSPHEIGFRNHGNTCYINSCMQFLVGLKFVLTEAINSRQLLCGEVGDNGILVAFSEFCQAYRNKDRDSINNKLKNIKSVMETLDGQFVGSKMQDASEFLGRFLDEIKEDVIKYSIKGPLGKNGSSVGVDFDLVFRNFMYEKEEALVCCSCRAETKSQTKDMSLWCDITTSVSRSSSLQQLLELSFASEIRTRRCEKCNWDQSRVTSKLVKLPKVLIIFLKRFRYMYQGESVSGKDGRRVSIPDTLCVSNMVSESVMLPDTDLPVLLIHDEAVNECSPSIHPENTSSTPQCPETPTKFKGLTEEQLTSLSEDDQLEYMTFLSEKEAFDFNTTKKTDDEDEEMKAAMDASRLAFDRENMGNSRLEEEFLIPSRKRGYYEYAAGEDIGCSGDNVKQGVRDSYANAVKANVTSCTADVSISRPSTKEQEEADLRRALELSYQEASFVDSQYVNMEEMENNNNCMDEADMLTTGSEQEHSYQLQSVVSHYGSSANAGHYVADVFRPESGGWFMYDDSRVTKTNDVTVRKGPNCTNGYILTYVYQPLWNKCQGGKY